MDPFLLCDISDDITFRLRYKESVVKFSYKYGVTKAAIKFCEYRRTIYRWRKIDVHIRI